MTNFQRYLFLFRYFLTNLVFSKFAAPLADAIVRRRRDEWEALKAQCGKHDAWLIVGNGPSLNVKDLELLAGIPAIASNKINLLFEKTSWRPKLYTVSDALVLFKFPKSQYDDFDRVLVPHTGYFMARTVRKLPWHMAAASDVQEWKKFGTPHPIDFGLLDGNTVTTYNIQLAMWLGAKTIYVIGCDHFYTEDKHQGVKKLAHGASASNHFDPRYRKPGEIVNSAPIEKLEIGYTAVNDLAKMTGVRIINITRKTALEVFERGNVEEAVLSYHP